MRDLEKYRGIIPAFYACYEDDGSVSAERTQALTQHLIDKNVKGVYVCGSSGECIYQSKEERKLILENVMKIAKGKITVIAHVACNNTADSQELAAHAESLGVDAIASFRLFISIFRIMRSRSTGMISAAQLQIQTLLFTISRSLQVWR